MNRLLVSLTVSTAVLLLGASPSAYGFANDHRVVIELTSGTGEEWNAVLNNVENLQKAFAPAKVEIEVVAHGNGLRMLETANAAGAARIERLANAGVKFAACENTMRRFKVERSGLIRAVTTVPSGVAEVVLKQEAGWAYLKSGSH